MLVRGSAGPFASLDAVAGFFGKFLIFKAVVGRGGPLAITLAFIGAAGVVISLYYYLMVVKRIYIDEAEEGAAADPIEVPGPLKACLWACLAGMFLLGIYMRPFLALAERAAQALVASG